MAGSLKASHQDNVKLDGRSRLRLWFATWTISAGMTLTQFLAATVPNISRDFRDSGPANFAGIFIAIGIISALIAGLVLGTLWWLAVLGIANIQARDARRSGLFSRIAVAVVAAIAGGISAVIAPVIYTSSPMNSPWFDFASVAIVTGTATLLLTPRVFRRR
jgi:hypothetical protein